jgi:hypothetical protein
MKSIKPVFVVQEHEIAYGDDIERCPCGSSLFYIRIDNDNMSVSWTGDTNKNTARVTIYKNVTDHRFICAVCGNKLGGIVSHAEQKAEIKQKDMNFKDVEM